MYVGNQNYVMVNRGHDLPHNYISTSNPTIDVNPPILNMTWLNTTTGEIFVCTDNTVGDNRWFGSLGREIPAKYSLIFNGVDSDTEAICNVTFPLTVELRFRLLDLTVGHVMFCCRFDYSNDLGFLFKYDTTHLLYVFSGSTRNDDMTDVAVDLKEHLLSFTVDSGKNANLYMDGVLLRSGLIDALSPIEDKFNIASEKGGGTFSNMELFEFRLWSTDLTQQEILNNLNYPLIGNESFLEVYYPLKETTPSVVLTDYAGSNDSVVRGNPLWVPL